MSAEGSLTQNAFMARHRAEVGPISPPTVHLMIAKGMPTVSHGKKPRFIWSVCHAWILAARAAQPVVQDARDLVFRRAMKKGA